MSLKNSDIQRIADEWFNFIKANSKVSLLANESIRLSTPFTDSFGDGIVINLKATTGEKYLVSDQGYTIWNLMANGIDVMKKNSNRYRILQSLIKPFSFQLDEKHALFKIVERPYLAQTINDFAQVLINVSDIAFLNRNNTAGVFFDDAKDYFNAQRDQYSFLRTIYADGKTTQKYKFEYVFTPKVNEFKLTKLYNTLSKNTMDAIIGIWSDTANFRDENYGGNASFNILTNGLTTKEIEYADGLRAHGIDVIDFADKKSVQAAFAINN